MQAVSCLGLLVVLLVTHDFRCSNGVVQEQIWSGMFLPVVASLRCWCPVADVESAGHGHGSANVFHHIVSVVSTCRPLELRLVRAVARSASPSNIRIGRRRAMIDTRRSSSQQRQGRRWGHLCERTLRHWTMCSSEPEILRPSLTLNC